MSVMIIKFFQHLFQERDEVFPRRSLLELRTVKYLDLRPVGRLLVEIGIRRSDLAPQNIEVFFVLLCAPGGGESKPLTGQAPSDKRRTATLSRRIPTFP